MHMIKYCIAKGTYDGFDLSDDSACHRHLKDP